MLPFFGRMEPATNALRKVICLFVIKALLALGILIIIVEYNISLTSLSTQQALDLSALSDNMTYLYYSNEYVAPPKGYLVWSNSCHMPDVDPFDKSAMKHFKKRKYSLCSNDKPLTSLQFDMNSKTFSLIINKSANGAEGDISCCYKSVLRSGTGSRVDNDFKLRKCVPFSSGYVLPNDIDSIIINCISAKTKKMVQKDAYFLVRGKTEVQVRLRSYRNRTDLPRAVSVMMLGIDTMSRFNLRRAMPETAKKLSSGSWVELSGYNKVADNTFPNLMAFLTGYDLPTVRNKCDLKKPGGLNDCNLIWDVFSKNGYVTAYAEDESWMSTFNYLPKGFTKPPVDYYHRPFMLAIEKTLKINKLSGMKFCVGRRHSAEYIYDFAMQFATRFKNEPYFGLFWTNTFTHNSFSDASAMDVRVAEYIDEMRDRGILDDSIVILFSDHGSRFGPITALKQGFLDERLPFFFIWIPPWFRTRYPMFMNALKLNRYRLTCPYDIYETLQHVLELSGRIGEKSKAYSCPNCQSIFLPVPAERNCKDAGIDDHWCTCVPFENVGAKSAEVVRATNAAISYLNSYLSDRHLSPPCANLKLKKINEAQKKMKLPSDELSTNSSDRVTYKIRFSVVSKANFEATVEYSKTLKTYNILSNISRLDTYASRSECVSDREVKKYCICAAKSGNAIKIQPK